MANVKLSQIASGGAIVPATDVLVGVRNGNTDVLLTPSAADGAIAPYSILSNNTNASAAVTAVQSLVLGAPGYTASGANFAQWTLSSNSYYQISLQNSSTGSSASSDFVVTANDGTDTTHYGDYGINNSNGGGAPFTNAHAVYLYSVDNELDFGALGASGVINFYTTGGINSPVKAGYFDASQNLNLTNALGAAQGGTGVANGSGSIITLGGAFAMSGAHTFTGTLTANTAVTYPTSGTLAILGANTFTALQTLNAGAYVSTGAIEEAVYSNGNSGTTFALNLDNGNLQSITITGAVAITQTTPTLPGKYTIIITQDGSGHVYSLSGVKFPGGTAPSYSTAANKIDVISIIYDGTNYYGMGGIAFA